MRHKRVTFAENVLRRDVLQLWRFWSIAVHWSLIVMSLWRFSRVITQLTEKVSSSVYLSKTLILTIAEQLRHEIYFWCSISQNNSVTKEYGEKDDTATQGPQTFHNSNIISTNMNLHVRTNVWPWSDLRHISVSVYSNVLQKFRTCSSSVAKFSFTRIG